MRSARPREPDLARRITEYLRSRGAPSGSVEIARRFLKSAPPSEEIATRLLRPLLEHAGLVYLEASGWAPPSGDRGSGGEEPRLVAVVPDAVGRDSVCVEVCGASAGRPASLPETSLAGAIVVLRDAARDGPRLIEQLARSGAARPASMVSLGTAVRGVVKLPRRAGLAEICGALGVRWLEGEAPDVLAAAMASCLAEAAARRAEMAPVTEPPSDEGRYPGSISAEMVGSLPEAPGVYRFFDADGALLYVGKAKNLRRRVASYFSGRKRSPGQGARAHGSRFLPRVDRLEWRTSGSELEALLKEARLIARHAPAANVQLQVHERGTAYEASRALALLLPCGDGRRVTVVLVRRGRYLGHASIGPRGGGLTAARRLIGRAVCARPEGGPGRRGGQVGGPADRDSEILNSWLARHGDGVSRLDLDGFVKVDRAAAALQRAVKELLADPGRAIFR